MCLCVCVVASVMSNSVIPWTVAHQALQSMGFSGQEQLSGLPCPPRDVTHVAFISRQVLYHYHHLRSPRGEVNWFFYSITASYRVSPDEILLKEQTLTILELNVI